MNKNIIATGFKPFAHFDKNSSWEAVKELGKQRNNILIKELTVDYQIAHLEITDLLLKHPCEILLLSGLSDDSSVKLETKARKPNELKQIEGPDLFQGHWFWKESINAINSLEIKASLSFDAGNYVCESVYWSALNFRRIMGYPYYLCFLHVPPISQMWSTNKVVKAMNSTLSVIQDTRLPV